jgi:hypothetical protein
MRHSFPGLPALLLSAADFVRLTLLGTPHSAYIPPEFQSLRPRSGLESLCQSRSTRSALHFLNSSSTGRSADVWSTVVQIGAPLLNQPGITFFPRRVIGISQFVRFTNAYKVLDESRVWRRSDCILLVIIIVFPSAFPSAFPSPHHRWTSATSLATRNRDKPVTATFTSVKNGSESPLIPGNRAIYHSSPARNTPGKNDRSVTHPAENRMRIIEYPKPVYQLSATTTRGCDVARKLNHFRSK